MSEAPSLPVDLVSLPTAGRSGPAVFRSLFSGARTYWLPGKRMRERKGCPVTARKAEDRRVQPWLAKVHCPHPSPGTPERHPTQTTSKGGVGVLLFSTDVTCHKPSQLVPPSKYLVLSFNGLYPTRAHSRCEGGRFLNSQVLRGKASNYKTS